MNKIYLLIKSNTDKVICISENKEVLLNLIKDNRESNDALTRVLWTGPYHIQEMKLNGNLFEYLSQEGPI